MAVQISNSGPINFGTVDSAVTIRFGRIQRASDDANPIIKQFAAPINAQANNALIVNAGAIDIIHNEGETSDDYMEGLVRPYWGGASLNTGMKVDLMGDSTTPIATTGYTQQTVTAWTLTRV